MSWNEGVGPAVVALCNVQGSYDVLLGQDWMRMTHYSTDLPSELYNLDGKVRFRQRVKQLEEFPPVNLEDSSQISEESIWEAEEHPAEKLETVLAQFGPWRKKFFFGDTTR